MTLPLPLHMPLLVLPLRQLPPLLLLPLLLLLLIGASTSECVDDGCNRCC